MAATLKQRGQPQEGDVRPWGGSPSFPLSETASPRSKCQKLTKGKQEDKTRGGQTEGATGSREERATVSGYSSESQLSDSTLKTFS